jgi:hypothetical protein
VQIIKPKGLLLVWWHHSGMTPQDDRWIAPNGEAFTHAEWLAKGQALVDRIKARFDELKANGQMKTMNQQYRNMRRSLHSRGKKCVNYPQYLYTLQQKALKELVLNVRNHTH